MVPLSRFYPKLMPLVIGCPEPLAQQALVDSAVAFCERSMVLTETLPATTTVVGQDTYAFNLPTGQAVATVLKAWWAGRMLQPMPTHSVHTIEEVDGAPLYFYGRDTDDGFAVRLYPTPDEAQDLVLRVALKPVRGATQLQDALYNDWLEPVVDGAVARITAVPDQAYTDFALSAALTMRARTAANAARLDGMHGKAQSALTVRMRPFA